MNEKKDLITKWSITNNRFVCYIDIMGFKDLVARSSHNKIYELMKKIDDFTNLNSKVDWIGTESEIELDLIDTTTYSDSIVIYSKDDKNDSLNSFTCTISGLIQDLLAEGIPFKGAIAYGTMTLNKERSIFFGQPLIDAYLLQEEVNFYGVIIHGSAQEKIEKGRDISFVENYLCPLKKGKSFHSIIVPIYLTITGYEKETKNLLESVKKMRYSTSGNIRNYIDFTEEYLNHFLI